MQSIFSFGCDEPICSIGLSSVKHFLCQKGPPGVLFSFVSVCWNMQKLALCKQQGKVSKKAKKQNGAALSQEELLCLRLPELSSSFLSLLTAFLRVHRCVGLSFSPYGLRL